MTKGNKLIPILYGTALSLALVWGYQLEQTDHLILTDTRAFLVWTILAILISIFTKISYDYIGRKKFKETEVTAEGSTTTDYHYGWSYADKTTFRRTFLILIICQLPVFLAVYPGFFCYDAQDEVNEVLTRTFSTHHPLLHVLLLGAFQIMVQLLAPIL